MHIAVVLLFAVFAFGGYAEIDPRFGKLSETTLPTLLPNTVAISEAKIHHAIDEIGKAFQRLITSSFQRMDALISKHQKTVRKFAKPCRLSIKRIASASAPAPAPASTPAPSQTQHRVHIPIDELMLKKIQTLSNSSKKELRDSFIYKLNELSIRDHQAASVDVE